MLEQMQNDLGFEDMLGMDEGPETIPTDTNEDQKENPDDLKSDDDDVVASADSSGEQPTEENELENLRAQNALLMQQLNTAISQTNDNNVTTPQETKDLALEESSLFGDWKFADIVQDEESFGKFLGDFAKKIMQNTEERLLQKLPTTVSKLTAEQMEARKTVDSFYAEHQQLAEVKPFMAKIVSTVASEHADWDLPKVLEESAERAYKALGLKKQATQSQGKSTSAAPAFVGQSSGRRASADTGKSKLEKELEELMELG